MFPAIPKKKRKKKPKRQTRRSLSLKGITYQRLKDYCDAEGRSVSGFMEDVIAEKLDAAGVPIPVVLRVHYPKKRTNEQIEGERAACFTM